MVRRPSRSLCIRVYGRNGHFWITKDDSGIENSHARDLALFPRLGPLAYETAFITLCPSQLPKLEW